MHIADNAAFENKPLGAWTPFQSTVFVVGGSLLMWALIYTLARGLF